jgi:bifunctional oligoribonuclease and PAP phosphatase NrnA
VTAAVSLPDERWAAAVSLVSTVADATLVCHVAPDGDALGSMLALARVLRARGVDVTCTWGDERWAVPASYGWLPDIDTVVPPSQAPAAPSLLVVLDTASRDRLGVLGPLADAAAALLVIDHHAHNSGLAGVQLIDAAAAATAVVVEELLRRLVDRIDAETATLLYVGLVTDTGSFQHSVTTTAVHAVAGRLLAAGVRPDVVAQQLWGSRPYGFARVLGAALSRLALDPSAVGGRGLVWTWTTSEDLVDAGLGLDEIEPVIEAVRATREADVAAVFKQDADGSYRVSTRSRGGTDVGAACAGLGGGGHRLAAGFTSYDDVETTARKLIAALSTAPVL